MSVVITCSDRIAKSPRQDRLWRTSRITSSSRSFIRFKNAANFLWAPFFLPNSLQKNEMEHKAGEKRPLDAGVEQGRPKRFRPAVSNSVSSNAPASSSSSFSDMPREPPSADAMYMDKRAGEIQAGIPDLSLDECLELARHEWLSLSAREREPMMDQWRQVENKYLADLKAWRAKNPHKSAELERQGIQKEEKEASREPAMKLHQL